MTLSYLIQYVIAGKPWVVIYQLTPTQPSFTMDKMLLDLGIDIDVIGFDADEQEWKS